MPSIEFSDSLKKTVAKLCKRDKARYDALLRKIEEIIACEDLEHYKNLRKPLQHLKRVHIDTHFVLTFRYEKAEDKITFYDFAHHDDIYRR
ncbi:hypothetical protein AUJ68_04355 [Candidatus Woesearchaeota archaeon CG1_02_57_44]|nr:MAG: hypothetical protein AUJ68_04355 [Candidatus Woesearchaeota archaeon CG1_02_57_44]PIN70832.1 MAG: hypothetical protein COV94_01070 [Candidatus Woesearchaeota archaeon CG11_big_fil_rev_8_21_14_0_20_57_5]